jgi:hypothetical protein
MHFLMRVLKPSLSSIFRKKHRVEAELSSSLPKIADCVVDANLPLGELIGNLLSAIAEFGVEAGAIAQARATLKQHLLAADQASKL